MASSASCYLLNNEENVPFLREIAKQDSYIEKVQHVMHIGLLPNTLGRLKTSINNTLGNKLRKYDSALNGILVGYENIALFGTHGTLIPGYSSIHVNIQVDCYVFKPEEGGRLSGTVVKKSAGTVTCLAHRVFTVFVSVPRHLVAAVELHQQIDFTIDKVDLCSQIPLVKAHLDEGSASASSHVRFDAADTDTVSETAGEPDSGLSSIDGSSTVNGLSPSTADPPPPRASKKRRRAKPEPNTEPAAADTASPRKKKRRKEQPCAIKAEPMSEEEEEEPAAAAAETSEMYLPDPTLPHGRQQRSVGRALATPDARVLVKRERSDQDVLNDVLDELLR